MGWSVNILESQATPSNPLATWLSPVASDVRIGLHAVHINTEGLRAFRMDSAISNYNFTIVVTLENLRRRIFETRLMDRGARKGNGFITGRVRDIRCALLYRRPRSHSKVSR